jgi:hypothetical protein
MPASDASAVWLYMVVVGVAGEAWLRSGVEIGQFRANGSSIAALYHPLYTHCSLIPYRQQAELLAYKTT